MIPEILGGWGAILADPPWRYMGGTAAGKPEGARGSNINGAPSKFRYKTMPTREIAALPVNSQTAEDCHLYLWSPNSVLPQALEVMKAWGFQYRANIVWVKRALNGDVYRGGLGNYFRNATELCLFGVKGVKRSTPARHGQHNVIETPRLTHSTKPDRIHELIEQVSPGPYLELFARRPREGWAIWGDQVPVEVAS